VTPLYPQKLALTSSTGGRSVGIVRSRTKATERVHHRGPYLYHLSVGRTNLFHYPEGEGSRFLQKLVSTRLHGVTYHITAGILFLSGVY